MLSIARCAKAPGTYENQMALHDWCHAASLPGTDIIPDVLLQCSASQSMQAHGSPENQMALHDSCHDASTPDTDIILDVLLHCSASQLVQKHMAHQKATWPCMTCVVPPVHLAMTSFSDDILQCSASQFVQQHMAHLRIRPPCMTSVMLPIYRAATCAQAHTRALQQCKSLRQATAASTQRATTCAGCHKSPASMQATKASNISKHAASNNVCKLTQEPCPTASHKGKQQLQAHSEQQRVPAHTRALQQCKLQRQATAVITQQAAPCAGSHKSPAPMPATKACSSCKHTASSYLCRLNTRALHQCKPQRQATAASTQRAATCAGSQKSPAPIQATKASNSCKHIASSHLRRLTQEPCTNASHKGKHQLQAHSKQQLVQAHTRALHQFKPQGRQQLQAHSEQQRVQAHTRACTNASHKGKHQLQAPSKQQIVQAHTRALHPCKPQWQATAASTQSSNVCRLTQEPCTNASAKAGNSCKHTASSNVHRLKRALHRCKPYGQATAANTQRASTCAGSHMSPAPMQATKASNSCKHTASSNVCRLTHEPCTNASHKGKQQLQAHSEQQRVQAHT